jgi:membrane protein YdbS with pleckstrin-like domain
MSRKKIWWSVGVVAVVALLVIVRLIFAPMLRSRATLDDCSALVP